MNEPIIKRLKKKFGILPKWAEDFSIETEKDSNVSRRDFIRFLSRTIGRIKSLSIA